VIQAAESLKWVSDGYEYWRDSAQRSILFGDTMRKRGNIYLDHLRKEQPPVLFFDYEMVEDGRDFERPVNYALVRILDRRHEEKTDRRQDMVAKEHPDTDLRDPAHPRRHKTSVAQESQAGQI